jgi:hypothetical protein
MDWRHLHLALNHVPVVGVPLLTLLLAWGGYRRSGELTRTLLWALVLMAAVSVAIKFTGDFAVEQHEATWAAVKVEVERHEQTADQATTGVFLMGLGAGGALLLGRSGRELRGWSVWVVVVLGLVTALLLARTANQGGRIVHPFLRTGASVGIDG